MARQSSAKAFTPVRIWSGPHFYLIMIDFKKINKKKILVTGGAGFIGSNLCEKLLEIGSQILCLDNLSTGQLDNIKEFKNYKNFKFIKGDIRDIHTCLRYTKNIDYVFDIYG